MTTLPAVKSYWVATTEATGYPRLNEDIHVDVAVIGGGIAGISTAWELTRSGRSAVLLEAGRIAEAVTGNTTGRLSAAHPFLYSRLRTKLGPGVAGLYASSQQQAVEHVASTAAELGLDCELERRASHVYAESPDLAGVLRSEADAAAEAGLPASFVTSTDLPFDVAGAVRVEDQVQFHPRRYLLGLAKAIVAAGGRIYEQTRVESLEEGQPAQLRTADGSKVTAAQVVVATLFPVFGPRSLTSRLAPLRELVIAAPIAEDRDPGGMYITREHATRSVRTAPHDGGRLLIVTGEAFRPGAGDISKRYEQMAAWAAEHFGATEVGYRWSAQDVESSDKIPFVGPASGEGNIYLATGYARSGMSHAVMTGRLLAALINGERPAWAGLYSPRRTHPLREAGPVIGNGFQVVRHRIRGRLATAHAASPSQIPRGSGAIVRLGRRLYAIYRDEDGQRHAVTANCTHRGCTVAFNDADKTWECPCHGSRFSADGTVLDGPANQPLTRHDLSSAEE